MLVDPPDMFLQGNGWTRQSLPMGPAMIAAAIRPHHDVTMLLPDTRAYKGDDPWGEIQRAMAEWKPDVVGITSVTATFPGAKKVAALAAELGITVVLGGVHVTFVPEAAARVPGVRAVVCGEGEETFPALLAALEAERAGRPVDLASIPGVYVADGDGVRHGPERVPIADLDALPLPDRESMYWKADLQPAFFQTIITMRGCPYRCVYCSVPNGPEGKTRYRSPTKVAEEAQHISKYPAPFPYIFYHDSVFTLHRKRTLAICDELERLGVKTPFAIQTRADRVDEALLDRLVEVGLHQVFFGIESGDRQSLKLIKKDMPLEKIRMAVAMVKARGIRCTGFFMVGFPWETESLIRATADFACDLELDAVSLFSATPLPGTELWEMSKNGALPESVDFRTPQVNLTAMPAEEYARVFGDVKKQLDDYNYSVMMVKAREMQEQARAAQAQGKTLQAWPGSGLRNQH